MGENGHKGEVQGNPGPRPSPTAYGVEREENLMYRWKAEELHRPRYWISAEGIPDLAA